MAGEGPALVRDEINFRGRAEHIPPEAVALVGSFTRGRPLAVVATLGTNRTARTWVGEDGRPLVEVVHDCVDYLTAEGRGSTFRQVEVELGPEADVALLYPLVERLTTAGATPEPGGIKVLKALGPDAGGPPDVVAEPLPRHPTARQVIQQALARSVVRLITELPVAQLGKDPEGVHQARVATRRLRSDLQTFGPLLDSDWAKALRRDLRPLAVHLGVIRDADVLLERFESTLGRHPEIDRDQAQGVLDLLGRQLLAAHSILIDYLAAGSVDDLLDRLIDGVVDPPTTPRADDRATERLPKLVRKRWQRLDKAVNRLGPDPQPAALHRVRILAKGTRYAAEAVSAAFGPGARRFAKSLTKVQNSLGENNDAIVAEQWLAANAGELDPASAFAAGRLAQVMRAEIHADGQGWTKPYASAARKKNRSWFA
jgi:CHAD domain-containing protein